MGLNEIEINIGEVRVASGEVFDAERFSNDLRREIIRQVSGSDEGSGAASLSPMQTQIAKLADSVVRALPASYRARFREESQE